MMPTWIHICETHGAWCRTMSGKAAHQSRLGCRPRKIRPGEQRKFDVITPADLKGEFARGLVRSLEGWGE